MACPHSDNQWGNYYNYQGAPYPPQPQTSFDHSSTMATDSVITTSSSPPPSTASPKPIRRRSRASKKTPTTLLNADASNFRSLVQQFTGRPSTPSLAAPGAHRGPVEINFGQGGSSFARFGSYGGDYADQQQFQYDQQMYGSYPNSVSYVGEDGLNVDDLDWEAISSSSTSHAHANDAHHFM